MIEDSEEEKEAVQNDQQHNHMSPLKAESIQIAQRTPQRQGTIRLGDSNAYKYEDRNEQFNYVETKGSTEESVEAQDMRYPVKVIVACVVLLIFGLIYLGISLFFLFRAELWKFIMFFMFSLVMFIPGLYYFVKVIILCNTKDEEKKKEIIRSLPQN